MNALIFPGQGSQQVGMGASFAEHHALGRQLFEEANDTLGFNLRRLCQKGPFEELTLTHKAQAALVTVGVIAYRLLAERVSLKPSCLAGHSVGEYAALAAAGALDFADALQLVYRRGQLMQEAVPLGEGTMAAILGLEDQAVNALCQKVLEESDSDTQVLVAANYNCAGQVVVSGHTAAVERILQHAKGKKLAVSAPFHSPLMLPAAEGLAPLLEAIAWRDALYAVVANCDNRFLTEAHMFAGSLKQQITAAVLWQSGVRAMIGKGANRFIELGSGQVLSGLIKRIDAAPQRLQVADDGSLKTAIKVLEA